MKTTAKCPKCDGHKHIMAFAHYANGVCFCCQGTGTITIDHEKARQQVGPETRKKADWVMRSTPRQWEKLSYKRLLRARNFCHGGDGLQQAYPELLAKWREVGEAAFQDAQERKLEEFYANRG